MADLPLSDEILDRPGHLLDGDIGIDPMLVEDIDDLCAKPCKRGVADLPYMLRAAVQDRARSGGRSGIHRGVKAELRRNHHPIAHRRQRLPHQLFIGEGTVNFGRVEEGDSPLHRMADQGHHLFFVLGRTIGKAHSHASKSQGRDLQIPSSQ